MAWIYAKVVSYIALPVRLVFDVNPMLDIEPFIVVGHAFFSFFAQLSLRISSFKTLIRRDVQAMSSSNPSSSHYYVAVPADGTKSTTSTSTATTAAASSSPATRVLRPKRRCFSLSRAFILLLLLGLLLFFLVPRRPIVRYQSSTLSLDESTSSVTLSQLFSYYNPNYYTVQWNNLHIQVEDQESATPLGYGWHNASFPVRALSSRSSAVNITITAAFSELAPLIKAQCAEKNYVTLASYGTVNAWIWSQNLGAIRIGPFTEVIDCGGAATMQYKRKVQDIRQEKKQERHQERLLPRWL
ncbi:uncharacterized protein Naga_100214g10 [Nannochloropsis gaditana]|uniref:Uncharacterized protein n=1 Tax=Nannochloropsis gaditana TaxID=72520 RepID=W7T3C4_9STRA|nr:uncharacterized protein Naga_100214g10 [Nannochloropsis gaditana]